MTAPAASHKPKSALINDSQKSALINDPPQPRIQFLHRILCSNATHSHSGKLYLDEPKMTEIESSKPSRSSRRLQANEQVHDLERFLIANPEISFVVFKFHTCELERVKLDNRVVQMACSCRNCTMQHQQLGRAGALRDRMRIVSASLNSTIRQLGKCRPDGDIFPGSGNDLHMPAPYLFLYHHRTEITEAIENSKGSDREHIELLKGFLDDNYGNEYDDADELFKKGMVSEKHLPKLFKPNKVIVTMKDGEPLAYVIHWWPFSKEGSLNIRCWYWEPNGFALERKAKQIMLKYDTDKTIPITQLEYFPLEFADKQLATTLLDRGQKFWTMRDCYFGTYSGWDTHKDHFYVRLHRNPNRKIDTKHL